MSKVKQPPKIKDPTRVAAGKKSKRKGSQGERDIVNWLKDHGIKSARRTQQFSGNAGDSDVIAPDEFPHLFIESKRYAKSVLGFELIYSWVRDLIEKCPEADIPIIFFRANKKEYVGMIFIEDFAALIKGVEVEHYNINSAGQLVNDFNKELDILKERILASKRSEWEAELVHTYLWDLGQKVFPPREIKYPSFPYILAQKVGIMVLEGEHLLALLKRHYLKIPLSECSAS